MKSIKTIAMIFAAAIIALSVNAQSEVGNGKKSTVKTETKKAAAATKSTAKTGAAKTKQAAKKVGTDVKGK